VEEKSPTQTIITELGGLTKIAKALSTEEKPFPISTVQGWKERDKIPQEYWLPLMEAAKGMGKELTLASFLGVSEDAA
jgi:hypothetical protein